MIELNFDKANGLVPAIAQDVKTGEILMLAYMDKEAWENTLKTGKATYFSRSRNKLWVKGETSGNIQIVKEILVDCDKDTVVLKMEQKGKAACHEGYRSCFFKKVEGNKLVIAGKKIFDPKKVYGGKK
jgi:phosphoribosyl-AMP cyclohydrolase